MRGLLEGTVIAGYNVRFDLTFLAYEWARLRWEPPAASALDVLKLARRVLVSSRYNLKTISQLLHIESPTHRALDDAWTTWCILEELVLVRKHWYEERLQEEGWFTSAWPAADEVSGRATGGQNQSVTIPRDILVAIENGDNLYIDYKDAWGDITHQTISPIGVDSSYIRAYCHLRDAERTFRMDRIQSYRCV